MEPPCPVSRRSAAAVPVRPRLERDQFNRASLCSVRTPCAKCAGGSAVGSQTRPRNDGKGVQVAVRAVAREQLCLAQPSPPRGWAGRPSRPFCRQRSAPTADDGICAIRRIFRFLISLNYAVYPLTFPGKGRRILRVMRNRSFRSGRQKRSGIRREAGESSEARRGRRCFCRFFSPRTTDSGKEMQALRKIRTSCFCPVMRSSRTTPQPK